MLAAVPATARAAERPPATLAESVMAFAAERNLVIAFDTATLAGLPARVAPRGLSPRQTIEALLAGTPVSVREVKRGVFVLLAATPSPIAVPPPATAPELPALVEPVTINAAYAQSLDRSLALKRKAAYGLDAVSAEDIARLPAFNAAEALQLAPGVSLERHRGVGLYVSVRGLGPQFQNVLLNGRPIALNDLVENGGFRGRQFRFEVLPADVIDQIEVVKTTTADMDEGALGGDIDVRTFKPLDRGRRSVLSVRASEGGRVRSTLPSRASGAGSTPSGRLGVLAGGVVERRRIRNDRLYQTGWNLDASRPCWDRASTPRPGPGRPSSWRTGGWRPATSPCSGGRPTISASTSTCWPHGWTPTTTSMAWTSIRTTRRSRARGLWPGPRWSRATPSRPGR
ncbi:TonB-dependent receptor plug domain-containing protein [Caulobacter segnis]